MDNKMKIMDIAMNLNRIGNWAADDLSGKRKRIAMFLSQTSDYIRSIDISSIDSSFKPTFIRFSETFSELNDLEKLKEENRLDWAEKMMTWGNILTHRSKLL